MATHVKMTNGNLVISHLTSKMEGMNSLSTYPLANTVCIANRQKNGSICKKCYSCTSLEYRKDFKRILQENFDYLSKFQIPENEIPFLNYAFFRFESHGEIINKNHLTNLYRIVLKNKHCMFALYSKNYRMVEKFFTEKKKPKNLIIIYSSIYLNKQLDITKFQFADKIFTVYDDKTQVKKINCRKKCIDCLKCYTHNKVQYINEFEKNIKRLKKLDK